MLNRRELLVVESLPYIPKGGSNARDFCKSFLNHMTFSCGQLAPVVLQDLKIERSEDLGEITYSLVKKKVIRSQENDSIEDFDNVFITKEVFLGDWYKDQFNKKPPYKFIEEYFN